MIRKIKRSTIFMLGLDFDRNNPSEGGASMYKSILRMISRNTIRL